MRLLHLSAILSLLAPFSAWAADSKSPKLVKPCTIYSPTSGSFFDLNALSVQPPTKEGKKAHKDDRTESWHAKGYDYQTNFTLNFCAPVVEELRDVVGVDEGLWRNVSAFYTLGGKTYSIGQQSSSPVFRGRKLVLNYTDGSPCGPASSSRLPRKLLDNDDDDDDDDDNDKDKDHDKPNHKKPTTPPSTITPRKSTLISLLCDRDPLAPKASISFVGASPDACTYFFEVRSISACGGVSSAQQTLGPAGVFGVIALIAIAVYVVGGCVYQRNVMHQRGWRQLPNYAIWAGIGSFVKDVFIIATSACARLVPRRRGYNQLPAGRGRSSDDENRLIDQLDEDWDD